jgi:flagellar basal-body rod modification protein FlgD
MTTSTLDTTLNNLGISTTSSQPNVLTASQAASAQTLNQADFLQLLTAQMQNQDPFNPTDNSQMVAQMAQFSQLSATTDMDTQLQTIASKLTGTSASSAMNYVGHDVLTAGNTAYPSTSGSLTGAVQLGGAASDVTVSIADASGNVLKTIDLGAQNAGTINYSWDGNGGSGPYTVTAAAQNGNTSVSAANLVWAPVQSVSVPASGDPTLNVTGVGSVAIGDVRQID